MDDSISKCSMCEFASPDVESVYQHLMSSHNRKANIVKIKPHAEKRTAEPWEFDNPPENKRPKQPAKNVSQKTQVTQLTSKVDDLDQRVTENSDWFSRITDAIEAMSKGSQAIGRGFLQHTKMQSKGINSIVSLLRKAVPDDTEQYERTPSPAGTPTPSGSHGGAANDGDMSNDEDSDEDDDREAQKRVKIPGAVHPSAHYLWIRKRQSAITRCFVACIVFALASSVLTNGLGGKVNDMITYLGIDPSIDLTPKQKYLIQCVEEKLRINFTIYNKKRMSIYCRTELLWEQKEISLIWANRTWYWMKDWENFHNSYSCPACPQIFDQKQSKRNHLKTCQFYLEYQRTGEFPTGNYPRKEFVMEGIWRSAYKNLVEDLNRQSHLQLKVNDIAQDFITVIDGESCLMRKGQIFDSFPQDTRTYHYVSCHKMYMLGVASNVPSFTGVKVFQRTHEESNTFIEDFVEYLLKIADMVYIKMKAKVQPTFDHLNDLKNRHIKRKDRKWIFIIDKLLRRLDTHCKQMIVGGYNIFKYDMILLKREGFLALLNKLDGPVSILKRSKGTYLSISSNRIKMVDQINYSGKTSLRQLLREYGIGADSQKSMFPYAKVQSLMNLSEPLPCYSDFHDELYQCNALDYEHIVYKEKVKSGQDPGQVLKDMGLSKPPLTGNELYKVIYQSWKQNKCKTLQDVAIYYLSLDLVPLLNFMLKQREIFLEEGFDIYPNFLSMSHFSFNYAHKFIKDPIAHFFVHIPLEQRQKLQQSLIGGLSIVFRRLCEPGMKIRPNERNDGECIKRIIGEDGKRVDWLPLQSSNFSIISANNLYGYSFQYPQFFGFFTLRVATDDFMPLYMGKKCSEAIEWLHYCSEVHYKVPIRTQYSKDGEQYIHVGDESDSESSDSDSSDNEERRDKKKKKQVRSFRVDGYFVEKPTRKSYVLEYLGEWYHGYCLNCRTDENDNEVLVGGKTSKELRESTFKRLQMIQSKVDVIICMYDCVWKYMKANVPEVRDYVKAFTFGPQIKQKRLSQQEAIDQILDGDINGFVMVDMTTPVELRNPQHLADFPPLIKNTMVSRENITGYGKTYAEKHDLLRKPTRMLMASYFCEQTYLSTDYIRFLDELGLRIQYVYEIMQYDQAPMFRDFIVQTTDERVRADLADMKHKAKTKKDEVNSSYGSCLMNASKMINVKLTTQDKLLKYVRNPLFLDAEACGYENQEDLWEIHTKKKKIMHRNLLTIGFQILQVSKVRLLDYFYNHMKRFIPDQRFQLINSDTDSLYYCISEETVRECVPKRLLTAYDKSCEEWHVNPECPYSKRTPGLFHSEFQGSHMVALGVKLYTCRDERTGREKKAHRGISIKPRSNLELLRYQSFKDTLLETDSELPEIMMTGFADKLGQLLSYESRRKNLHSGYPKRFICDDLYSTETFEHL